MTKIYESLQKAHLMPPAVRQTEIALLVRERLVGRRDLLSKVLKVLVCFSLEQSDTSQLDLDWFKNVFAHCDLSLEDRQTMIQDFIRLLSCRNPKIVAWSVEQLSTLVSAKDLPVDQICEGISGVFLLKGKAHANLGLKLLKELSINHSVQLATVSYAPSAGLDNESPEIQNKSFVLLENLGYSDARSFNYAIQRRLERARRWQALRNLSQAV